MNSPNKPIHTIVLDAGPILKNDPPVSTLLAKSENLVTVPSVISEIKDAAARARVETMLLPFLTIRTPTSGSVKFITEFARKTGDLSVLSKVDISLLALSYELECERNDGDWRLRRLPGQKGLNGTPPKTQELPTQIRQLSDLRTPENARDDGISLPTVEAEQIPEPLNSGELYKSQNTVELLQEEVSKGLHDSEDLRIASSGGDENTASTTVPEPPHNELSGELDDPKDLRTASPGYEENTAPTTVLEPSQNEASEGLDDPEDLRIVSPGGSKNTTRTTVLECPQTDAPEALHDLEDLRIASPGGEESSAPTTVLEPPQTEASEALHNPENLNIASPGGDENFGPSIVYKEGATDQNPIAPDSESSDSEGWITPSNLKKHQEKDLNASTAPIAENTVMQVATMTTDFAMQNVLLQVNLNLLSPTLQRVRTIKTYVLRCHACFQTVKDMSKQFCPRCGKPTLTRVSCSTNQKGEFRIHLKKNMQWNNRGNRYSIPKPVHGSANGKAGQGKGGGKGGWGQELILAEDQKEYLRAANGNGRRETDLMDEDYLPGILTGDRRRAGGRPKVGAGRDVNSKKR